MNREIIISDLKSAVKETEYLSENCTPNLWEVVSYETAEVSGSLLIASPETFPKPVTIEPKLTGWYKIYVCMIYSGGGGAENHIHLKLTDDEFSLGIQPGSVLSHVIWHAFEQVEEGLWKVADMTGQSITISKVDYGQPHTASVCWFRFVEMSDEEIAIYKKKSQDESTKTMLAHIDGDIDRYDMAETVHDYCRALYSMKNSDVKIVSQEIINDFHDFRNINMESFVGRDVWQRTRKNSWIQFQQWKDEIYQEELTYAHKHNMELFAAHRISLTSLVFPSRSPLLTEKFVDEHPQYRCQARDGRMMDYLSFAYKEVQDYRIEQLKSACKQGFDGVNLLYIRGVNISFEEPVVRRFCEKYGNTIDCRRLPITDSRIYGIWCDVLTDFMKRLKTELDECAKDNNRKPMKIYVTTMFSIKDNLTSGIDVERWAKEGLIDGIVQGKMNMWEEIDDVLADDGLIDIEKYEKKAETQYIFKREFGDIRLIMEGVQEYRLIADKYDVKIYSELNWENTAPPAELVKIAQGIYDNGGQAIALWDCYPHRVAYRPEWQCTSNMGSAEKAKQLSIKPEDYTRIHKILSYNGRDMRYYHPNWRT